MPGNDIKVKKWKTFLNNSETQIIKILRLKTTNTYACVKNTKCIFTVDEA